VAERPDLTQALRRVSEANLRYYEALGKLTIDYWSSVFGVLGELSGRALSSSGVHPQPTTAAPAPAAAAAAPIAQAPAMVLEAPVGGQAMGAFLVENRLARRLSTPIVASTFVTDDGREVRPRLQLDPEVVTLEPGEQVLVRVLAAIDEQLESGVTYRGTVTVPGLSGHNVRLVLRRRGEPAPAPPPPAPTAPATGDVMDTGSGQPRSPRRSTPRRGGTPASSARASSAPASPRRRRSS